ncbi:SusC/RagA family TonB-linked outer membrane protein [Membranihabitans maritimus]|uniref:SusC/RagA family TonB-linked outer membrane protein n=1 Tax=Membranihabitans maritimus TaxID=2904244 RepID=UPI001F378CDD|nr:TonB-dependent receptor [Membranihabitans maritimus]
MKWKFTMGFLMVVGVVCLCLTMPKEAKAKKTAGTFKEIQGEKRALIELIRKWEAKYNVLFTYDRRIVESVEVEVPDEDMENIDNALDFALDKTELKYTILESRYVILYRNDKEGIESLENMIQHLSKIIDSEKKTMAKRAGKTVDRLHTHSALDIYNKRLVINVSGTVTNQAGEPLIGVNVLVKGTDKGTATDFDGKFMLEDVDEEAVLIVSYIGYQTQEVPLNGKHEITITLLEDSQTLDEVVVVGYGTQKKSDVTGAIGKVSGAKLQKRPVARVDQALQGQMSGVLVQQSGGKPGKNANIRVRGVGSVTAGVAPLYVVDGFPVDGSTFANMNLANIESIEVLKDAAATSIYGSRGSNGVVIVTTKQGEKGQKLKLDLNAFTGISNVERIPKMMNAKEQMELIADEKDGDWVQAGGDLSVPPLERPYNFRYDQNLLNDPNLPSYDHIGAILQTGITQNYNLSASGSSGNTRFFVSGEYYDQTGIVKNTSYKRYSARANITTDINEYLSIGLRLSPTYLVSRDKDTEGKEGIVHRALSSTPILPPRLGYWGESEEYSTFLLANRSPYNLAIVEHLKDKETRLQLLADVNAEVKLLSGLTFKTRFGANVSNDRRDQFENQIIRRNQAPTGAFWGSESLNWLNENLFNFSKTLDDIHKLNAILGFTAQKQENKSSFIRANGFANDYVTTLNAATEYNANTQMSEWSLLSYLSRVNYSFDDKYIFQGSIRRDGSSRFGANTKWGWFPSASMAWKVDREEFMENSEFISQLKFKFSWGITGNNSIGNYAAIGGMSTSSYLFGTNETITPGLFPSSISNPNLSWEKTTSTNIGLDLGVFGNRFSLGIDFYNNLTNDLLLRVPVPTITGFSDERQNYGEVENKGVDFSINSVNIDGELNWSTSFNISFLENKVLKLGPNDAPIFGGFQNDFNITTVGQPIGSYYLLKQTGVYNTQEEIESSPHWSGSQPGDIIVEDYNGDGTIDEGDRQILGSNIPKYFWGLTNQFSYKGFDLSIFLNGAGGNKIFNIIGRQFDRPQGAHNVKFKHWVNRWRSPDNPGDGMTPRMWGANTGAGAQITSRMLYDGDYIRLRNITLGYTLPNQILNKLSFSSVRIYVQGENLYTWDYYSDVGFSPEADMYNGNATSGGNDYGIYPTSRTFLFGLNVSF